jgi:predicted dehydrogenase
MFMASQLNRRAMLRRTAAAGAGLWLAGRGRRQAESASPNERLNLAIVGSRGRGAENLKFLTGENIVALCDVDSGFLAQAAKEFPKARTFRDYRKLLDAMHREIDAVVVSTPDHMHAPISLRAMKLDKHVYCEKPLTWCIAEARLMAKTAGERKLATQMGTQGMAENRSRAGIEVLRSGVLGRITEMHVWTDRAAGWWPQGVDRPRDTPPVPNEVDWDLWLGVAPPRPYHPDYCPFKWRGWKDFGTGPLGDMGIHNAAMPYAALELGLPKSAEIVETSGLKGETFPAWATLKYEFAASGNRGSLTLYWYDGGRKPSAQLLGGLPVGGNGAILVGTNGTLWSREWTGGDWTLLPREKFRGHKPPEPSVPRAPEANHYLEWIRACKGGPPAFCRFDGFAAMLTETMLLGDLALRVGKKVEWDAQAMKAPGCPEAEEFIGREYRKGWEV